MHSFPQIRPIKDQAEVEQLRAAAAADGHELFLPTHTFKKVLAVGRPPEIVGYCSMCFLVPLVPGIPTPRAAQFQAWFHSQKVSARESFNLFNNIENILASAAPIGTTGLVPCPKDSPFFEVMPSMGYAPVTETVLWGKVLA